MRVGIDIRSLETESAQRGIGTYTRNLIRALVTLYPEDEWVLFHSRREVPQGLPDAPNIELVRLTRPQRITTVFDQIAWPLELKLQAIDVFHSTEFAVPRFGNCPTVLTIYDLIPMIFPEYSPRGVTTAMVYDFKFRSATWATAIIAVSQATADDLQGLKGVPNKKIFVIPLGFDQNTFHSREDRKGDTNKREAAGVNRREYFLYVGGFDPRKQVDILLEAFVQLIDADPDSPDLVLVGPHGPGREHIMNLTEQHGVTDRVLFTGRVDNDTLAAFYRGSLACILPSRYEGFGLTPLEAMACGTAVAARNTSSIPEVVGDAGLLFDDDRVETLSEVLRRLHRDRALRLRLSRLGPGQASRFTWNNTARLTRNVYSSVTRGAWHSR